MNSGTSIVANISVKHREVSQFGYCCAVFVMQHPVMFDTLCSFAVRIDGSCNWLIPKLMQYSSATMKCSLGGTLQECTNVHKYRKFTICWLLAAHHSFLCVKSVHSSTSCQYMYYLLCPSMEETRLCDFQFEHPLLLH